MAIKLIKSTISDSGDWIREETRHILDMSIFAHLKFEENFAYLQTDLSTFSNRFRNSKLEKDYVLANLLSMLKIVYCYLNNDDIECFSDFTKLFNLADSDSLDKNINAILIALESVNRKVIPEKK